MHLLYLYLFQKTSTALPLQEELHRDPTLECVPGGQLQLPRVGRRVRTGDLAESPLVYIFGPSDPRIGEIGVVEGVERVKADL